MRRSLAATLILSTTTGTAAVLVAAGLLLNVLVRSSLTDQFDRALLGNARLLVSGVERENGNTVLEFEDLDMRDFEGPESSAYLELWRPDGSVLFRSPSLGAVDLERVMGPVGSPAFVSVALPNGRPGRAVGMTFTPQEDEDNESEGRAKTDRGTAGGSRRKPAPALTLVMARSTAPVDAMLARFRTVSITVGLATVAVTAGALWVFVRRGLRPLDRLADQIGGMGEQDLSQRVRLARAPAELEPVVARLNDLLSRLESAFQRECRFGADVAHELRTPLAGFRSTLDVALLKQRQPAEYQEALGRCLRISVQLQAMVERLMSLGRLDAGQVEVRPEPVSLNALVCYAWSDLAASADARRLRMKWFLGTEITIFTDRSLLGLAVRNILENAVVHADAGGSVTVETSAAGDSVELRVTNSGNRLSEEQASHVFERFWRGDAARTNTGTHSGLGLPLVKKITEVLGGGLKVRTVSGGDFEITIVLPLGSHSTRAGGEHVV